MKRIFALILALVVLIAFSVSFEASFAPEHNCSGEHCVVCLAFSFADGSSYIVLSILVALFSSAFLTVFCGLVHRDILFFARSSDLVFLKVKLSD